MSRRVCAVAFGLLAGAPLAASCATFQSTEAAADAGTGDDGSGSDAPSPDAGCMLATAEDFERGSISSSFEVSKSNGAVAIAMPLPAQHVLSATVDVPAGGNAFAVVERSWKPAPRRLSVSYSFMRQRTESYVEFGCSVVLLRAGAARAAVYLHGTQNDAPVELEASVDRIRVDSRPVDNVPPGLIVPAKLEVDLSQDIVEATMTFQHPTPPSPGATVTFPKPPDIDAIGVACGIGWASSTPAATSVVFIDDVGVESCP